MHKFSISWAKVGDLSFEDFDKTKAGIFKPVLEAETSGRYVKFVFDHDTTWIFVSEVEVYGFEKEEIVSKSVTVVNGKGGGEYKAGETVSITANSAPKSKEFDSWVATDNIALVDMKAKSTSFVMVESDVTVEATYKELPQEIYLIEVLTEGKGTASADLEKATSGEQITLTAVANRGSLFKEWQVIEGGVTIDGVINASFTMPENKVVVKAIFEEEVIEPIKYLVLDTENDEWEEGSDFGITIETDAEFDKFVELRINDDIVDASNYELKEGSTILTLNAEYLSILSVGKYNVELVFIDGSAKSEFSILEKEDEPGDDVPQTSDYTILFILLSILTFSITTYAIKYYHRKGLC